MRSAIGVPRPEGGEWGICVMQPEGCIGASTGSWPEARGSSL